MVSKVYFTDMRARKESLLNKLERIFDQAGFAELINPKDLVAIKLHFGERGNTSYIRPQFIRKIVDKVKAQRGKPFLTDTNTLYVGSRSNSVDHLQTAIENGFDYAIVNAPLVIADGLNGRDYIPVEINQKHFNSVKIGSAAIHADVLISVAHFKGHMSTGFGGTLKNLGMGLGSRSGKQMQHSDVLPNVSVDICVGCSKCLDWCPGAAIEIKGKKAKILEEACIGCGECTVTCPTKAIAINWRTEPEAMQEKIVEYSMGVLKNKQTKAGFIAFVNNVTPDCDCVGWSDSAIVNDIGILASKDPIALEQACVDLVNQAEALPNSALGDRLEVRDKFKTLHPHVDWEIQLKYGEKIGLGSRKYELVKV